MTVVYPANVDTPYKYLARRIATACEELSLSVRVCEAGEFALTGVPDTKVRTLMLVGPSECAASVSRYSDAFYSKVDTADKKVGLLSDAITDNMLNAQLDLPIEYDAFLDAGLHSQKQSVSLESFPYRFLFNGPTIVETKTMECPPLAERPIPWSLVGTMRPHRARLLGELVEKVDPGGFVFMDKGREAQFNGSHWKLDSTNLSKALAKTKYYVWNSLHERGRYEDTRFRTGLLAGAVPCKISYPNRPENLEVPWAFSSVEDFRARIEETGFAGMYQASKDFYLSRGLLSENLERVLSDVL